MRLFVFSLQQGLKSQASTVTKGNVLKGAFGKYLLLTNTVSSGLLMAVGDFCQQKIEKYQAKPKEINYDFQRTANLSIVALGHGIFHHFFYGWMDKKFPVNSLRYVSYKIFLDQLIASPACMWIFFVGVALLEKRGYDSGWAEMKKKFLFCYAVDWLVWPPNQFINFYYVPNQYRVIYINCLTMLYDIFLSYLKFYDQFEDNKDSTM